jgi:hypothetical protein
MLAHKCSLMSAEYILTNVLKALASIISICSLHQAADSASTLKTESMYLRNVRLSELHGVTTPHSGRR